MARKLDAVVIVRVDATVRTFARLTFVASVSSAYVVCRANLFCRLQNRVESVNPAASSPPTRQTDGPRRGIYETSYVLLCYLQVRALLSYELQFHSLVWAGLDGAAYISRLKSVRQSIYKVNIFFTGDTKNMRHCYLSTNNSYLFFSFRY